MADYTSPEAVAAPLLEHEYRLNEPGTLEHLLDVCQDAALGARLSAELFADDNELATFFNQVAAERDGFATRLAILLSRKGYEDDIDSTGTFRGKLFHWRLHLAKSIESLHRNVDDRRADLQIISQGSDQVLKAYEKAEGAQVSPEAHEEIRRQAELIRSTNAQIHRLWASSPRRVSPVFGPSPL
ncbi:MAG: hypothetical protein QNL12_14485 [Acidimicrobiia bacterium]|nr:hypothetical protein [Acidimicrobiia bacterium]MDX2468523.1 hypothetical protein [Acidimicrobiia bacterium]